MMQGNIGIKCRNETWKKSISEVVKIRDSNKNNKRHIKNKDRANQEDKYADTRDVLSCSVVRTMQYEAGENMCRERINH